jgi:hypothetical protein
VWSGRDVGAYTRRCHCARKRMGHSESARERLAHNLVLHGFPCVGFDELGRASTIADDGDIHLSLDLSKEARPRQEHRNCPHNALIKGREPALTRGAITCWPMRRPRFKSPSCPSCKSAMALSSTEVSRLPSKNSMVGKNWGDSQHDVFPLVAAAQGADMKMIQKI